MKEIKEKFFNIKKAVIFIVISAISFSLMALFAKIVTSHTKINIIILFRFGISFLYALLILGLRKIKKQDLSLKTNHLLLHFFRALLGLIALSLLFISLKFIPLLDGNLLIMTSALFIPIIGAIFLHSKTDKKHWIAIIIGFIGVAFILKPGHDLFNPMALLALLAGLIVAIIMIILRRLSKYDKHYVIMFYYFLFISIASGLISIFNWQKPDFYTIILLLGVGVFGTIYQIFLIKAAAHAPAKITSSLLYSSLIFSIIFDWLFWHDIPDLLAWIGIILVCFSSILTIFAAKRVKIK